MSNPSNLYAEKIFSEHPIALWALDDKNDYISLISESQRNFFNPSFWTVSSNATASQQSVSSEPFVESSTTRVTAVGPSTEVVLTSTNIKRFVDLDSYQKTFSIGLYLYDITGSITSISVGYQYGTGPTQVLKSFETSAPNKWVFASETFPFESLVSSSENIKLVIKINYLILPATTNYEFLLNGLTFGQWSENFSSKSLGTSLVNIPSNIAVTATKGLEARAYGLQDLSGYYLSDGTKMLAKNSGVPLVFGASSTTTLLPLDNFPSLIVPGCGFLNKSGQYKTQTVEMWMRINSDTFMSKRIFGPIASTDGLYVDGPFLTLKIGDSSSSHFVGEWFRPMLIHIRIIDGSASLLVNGDEVLTMSFSTPDLNLPDLQDANGKSQDWLGFYSYGDISPIEIDCVAIYAYAVPAVVAKRRFAYGQAVEFPEKINSAYNGTSVFVDYSFANYANNYTYPEIGNWSQGIANNLVVSDHSLSTPDYPEVTPIFNNKTAQQFYYDQFTVYIPEDPPGIRLRPNSSWNSTNGYLFYPNINFLKDGLKAIYGIFELNSQATTDQVLFEVVDSLNGDYLSIVANSGSVIYKVKLGSLPVETLVSESSRYVLGQGFIVGFNINSFVSNFGSLALFFGNLDRLELYVGGKKSFTNTFLGEIFGFSFCNANAAYQIKELFAINGLVDPDYTLEDLTTKGEQGFKASYELNHPISYSYSVGSSWQDYIPLSYFAKNVTDINGDQYYDLDFIQFNLGYPKNQYFKYVGGKTYYDTSDAILKTYITFQTLQSGANAPIESFINTQPLSEFNVINPGDEWINTKYEILDNTIIYIPKNIDFNNVAIVTHMTFNVTDSSARKVIVKNLQYSSQSFNEVTPTEVGTRFGKKVYPYKSSGLYYNYKNPSPFLIYKGNTPYLYLTKKSGLRVIEDGSNEKSGLSIPINENLTTDYKIIATQFSMFYDKASFAETPTPIFEIESKDLYLKFYLRSSQVDGFQAQVFAVNAKTGQEVKDIVYYINGNVSLKPTVNLNEWLMLGISFPTPLSFRSYLGAIRITGPVLINNISYYESTNLQEIQSSVNRPWSQVLAQNESTNYIWNFWNENFIWGDVLVLSTTSAFGVDASNIYQTYTGTNKIIIDDTRIDLDLTNSLVLQDYQYIVYQDIALQSRTLNAV
jgi:hypothetical protein